jgi:hypothetical protein
MVSYTLKLDWSGRRAPEQASRGVGEGRWRELYLQWLLPTVMSYVRYFQADLVMGVGVQGLVASLEC